MAWVYLDDGFPDHPKVARAGGPAAWLFVCGLAYSRRHDTKGMIPKAVVPRLTDAKQPAKLAKALVDVVLWEDQGDHYYVHDYHEWNKPTEARSAAGRKAAMARWAKEGGTANGSSEHANGNAIASESHEPNDEIADAPGCPPPRPRPNVVSSLHRQASDGGGLGDDDGDRINVALGVIADCRIARLAKPPRYLTAYRLSVIADIADEWRPRMVEYVAAVPSVLAEQLAAWVLEQGDPPPDAGVPAAPSPRPCSDPSCATCDGAGAVFDAQGAVVERCWADTTGPGPLVYEPFGATA